MSAATRQRRLRAAGWIDRHGDLTPAGEHRAEYEQEARAGYWDPPAEFDTPSPTGNGWAPDPFPGGGLI